MCSVVFGDRLGLEYQLEPSDRRAYVIAMDGKQILLPDIFFSQASARWLSPESLATDVRRGKLPSAWQDDLDGICLGPLPLLFGTEEVTESGGTLAMGLDVFGSIFYLLTCYEEAALPSRDAHDAFLRAHPLRTGRVSSTDRWSTSTLKCCESRCAGAGHGSISRARRARST